jgi:hypothetical protein
MRINPNGIPTPRPMARDFEFDGVGDGDEVAEDVLVGVVTVVFVMEGIGEEVVGAGEIDAEVDVTSSPCRRTIVPTGIEKPSPASQQLVPFGPQQYVIIPETFSPSGHGNKLFPNCDEELPMESQSRNCCESIQ